jgi:hypothetical protein
MGDEAGLEREDAVEFCRERGLGRRGSRATVGLEIAMELPDRGADGDGGGAVLVREGVELVNEPPLSRGSAWTQHNRCRPTLN